jgi:hypothetical protein
VRHSASTRISADRCVRFGKLGRRHLIAEVFRTQGKQLDERGRGKVRLHELVRAREGERCVQLPVDFGEKQWPARQRS